MALELNGTTGVSLVQDGVVTAADLASTLDLTGKTVTLPAGTGGKVLQIVSTTKTDTFTTTSTTFTDVTGLSVSITPSSSSSKILVISHVSNASWYNQIAIRLVRNSTAISVGDTAGSRVPVTTTSMTSGSSYFSNVGFMYLDSPSTTSATTYKIQISTTNFAASTVYINRGVDDTVNNNIQRGTSSITVMEIAA